MNCCDPFGNCTQGPGCPVRSCPPCDSRCAQGRNCPARPLLITDEGPEDVDTSRGLLLEDYPDWQLVGLLVLAALCLFLISAFIGLALAVRLYGWPF